MPVRVCVIGGGLAGCLLAWRLGQATTGWRLDLVLGPRCDADATSASGGAVRAFETNAEQRRLAAASMLELLGSTTLRAWAGYRQLGSVYLCHDAEAADGGRQPRADVQTGVAEIETLLPGSCQIATAGELIALGWDVAPSSTAVTERHAGYVLPDRLREHVLADLGQLNGRLTVLADLVRTVRPRPDGAVRCELSGGPRDYDIVVAAAGAWTGALLRASGLDATGYRTKSIQYSLYPTEQWRPPHFVDEATGLYGRPSGDGELLLGLATSEWDVDPDHPPTTPGLHDRAAALARQRFPKLRLGAATHQVGSADCYADQPVLALRPVVPTGHHLFTFSGGAGGSVKTALAASHRAAIQLVESDPHLN